MKCCSRCHQDKPLSEYRKRQNYCRSCQKEYMKQYRFENRQQLLEYSRTHRKPLDKEYQREYQKRRIGTPKVLARRAANLFFKDDPRLAKCVDCGAAKHVDKAHIDYEKPLTVVPLCRIHHKRFDSDSSYRAKLERFAVVG